MSNQTRAIKLLTEALKLSTDTLKVMRTFVKGRSGEDSLNEVIKANENLIMTSEALLKLTEEML